MLAGLFLLPTFNARPIKDFLQRTAEVVPCGRETAVPSFRSQVDAALARLLAEA